MARALKQFKFQIRLTSYSRGRAKDVTINQPSNNFIDLRLSNRRSITALRASILSSCIHDLLSLQKFRGDTHLHLIPTGASTSFPPQWLPTTFAMFSTYLPTV